MKKIVVIGEILVEIMADTVGRGFHQAQALTGPFPSGAPAIFASQAARLGQPVAILSAVGRDDFGQLNLDRLAADGVDISGVYVDPERPTGSAFVRYRADGARDFVFNIKHSASGRLMLTEAAQSHLDSADHVHIMGTSLSSSEFIAANLSAAEAVKARGGTVSFDPNLRPEILAAPGMRAAMAQILSLCDLYLPSGEELILLTRSDVAGDAVAELLDSGVGAIIHKLGAVGARYHDAAQAIEVSAFPTDEVDPTGAGDCFGATFTALWLRGVAPGVALRAAAAAGALAVSKRGPMEGAAPLAEIEALSGRSPEAAP